MFSVDLLLPFLSHIDLTPLQPWFSERTLPAIPRLRPRPLPRVARRVRIQVLGFAAKAVRSGPPSCRLTHAQERWSHTCGWRRRRRARTLPVCSELHGVVHTQEVVTPVKGSEASVPRSCRLRGVYIHDTEKRTRWGGGSEVCII